MRVIAGKYRSRPLLAPAGMDTRPTTDRLRETLFNVLTQGVIDRVAAEAFLDLYAGSGAVGIEALSRDAGSATFVEHDAVALAALRKNLGSLGLSGGRARVEIRSVSRFLRHAAAMSVAFGVIFLDPPWDLDDEYSDTLAALGGECACLVAEGGIVVAEHRKKRPLLEAYGRLTRTRELAQGDAALSFYEAR